MEKYKIELCAECSARIAPLLQALEDGHSLLKQFEDNEIWTELHEWLARVDEILK